MDSPSSAPPPPQSPEPARRSAISAFAEREEILLGLYDLAPRGVLLTRPDGTIVGINATASAMLGYTLEELQGRHFNTITHPDDTRNGVDAVRAVLRGEAARVITQKRYIRKDGHAFWTQIDGMPIRDESGKILMFATYIEDITEQRRQDELRQKSEAEHLRLQQQIIATQRDALQQLSTPLIPIREGVLAVPLIGAIDRERAHQLLSTVLDGVSTERASMVIVDITGVVSIDGEVASLLARLAQSVKLLGAQVLLSGIRAEVAQRMIEIGVNLAGVQTVGSFQSAIAMAFGAPTVSQAGAASAPDRRR